MVAIVIIPATIFYGTWVILASYRSSPGSRALCAEIPRRWSRLVLKVAGARVVLENAGVIDPDRPQILVANHVSWFDVLALQASIPGRTVFVAKRELRRVPLFGRAVSACGHIFIDRRDRNQAVGSLVSARKRLEEESPTVIMFPEGTRSPTGELQEFKKGAFVLAIQTGADVVPAAISGSREVMRKGSLMVRPGTITVRFGAPIPVTSYDIEQRNELTRKAREALLGLQASGKR
jgi:1-acyl-sn-glycerol-3-phosphate acyltransferase